MSVETNQPPEWPHDGFERSELDDDVVHGLLAAMADRNAREIESRLPSEQADVPEARRVNSFLFTRALATAAVLALAVLIAVPFARPSSANAAEIIRTAERHFSAAKRVYDIRVMRWAGPVARRMLTGEVEFRPGPPPVSEGFLVGGRTESGEPAWRVTFGRDEQGPWVAGNDAARRARPIVRQIVGDEDDGLGTQDIEALTLDAVLSRLRNGYDLEMSGSSSMRTIVAKRREGVRMGPQRVELELARDGQTVERAKVEIARTGAPMVIELRLRERS
jgi:hypothetical protein